MEFHLTTPSAESLEEQMPLTGFSWRPIRRLHRLIPFTDRLRELTLQLRWNEPLIARRPILWKGDFQNVTHLEHNLAAVESVVDLCRISVLPVRTGQYDGDLSDDSQFHNFIILPPIAFESPACYPRSLLSGYKSNSINWLAESSRFPWESDG